MPCEIKSLDNTGTLCYNYRMLIYTYQRSRKKRKTKKQIAKYQNWLSGVKDLSTNFSSDRQPIKAASKLVVPTIPADRDPRKYNSLNSTHCDTSKKTPNVYTGDKMVGIGTLHKSNAIPIFSKEDAKDQAKMRR